MKNILLNLSKIIHYLPYLGKVVLQIKNPIAFFGGYFKNIVQTIYFYNGIALKTENSDDISSISAIFIKNEYGENFGTKEAGVTVIDIGANKGYLTLKAANNPLNKVYAFEPITSTFEALEANILLNKSLNVVATNVGVASKNEERTFNFSAEKSIISSMVFSNEGQTEKVKCITLSDIFIDNNLASVDLLKMDCEGAEFEILYNTDLDVLAKINWLKMEYHDFPSGVEATFNINGLTAYLEKMNFELVEKRAASPTLGIAWFRNKNTPSAD